MSILNNKKLIIFISILFAVVLAYTFVHLEDNVYYWDYNGYWRAWEHLSQLWIDNPYQAQKSVINSIRNDDYNSSPILLVTFFKLLPFSSRESFILGLTILYLIPTAILFNLLSRSLFNDRKYISLFLAITFTAFWAPLLNGYPDICGLIFIIWSVHFCTKHDLVSQVNTKKALQLGLLLWAPFLLRRWYAYTVVSLYVTLPILCAFYHKYELSLVQKYKLIINFFISGMTSLILGVAFQLPLLKRIISTDYAYIYSAYQRAFVDSFYSVIYNSGIIFSALVVVFSIVTLYLGGRKQKLLLSFFWANLALSFFLFTRTQSPGIQHDLPFSLWMLFIVTQGFVLLLAVLNNNIIAKILTVVMLGFALFNQMYSTFNLGGNIDLSKWLAAKHLPLKVENYSEYLALNHDILALTDNNKKVSIFSSNNVLNDDMLMTLSDLKLTGRINYASQVDLRDKFNPQALMVDYVIVTNPVQIHLKESGQRVITIPARDILENKDIGNAFVRLDREYKLTNNVSAWIYKKVRAFKPNEISGLWQQFYHYYPEWQNDAQPNMVNAYMNAQVSLGDVWGSFLIDGNGDITAHPGENTATVVKWYMTGINRLKIESTNTTCNMDDSVHVSLTAPGVSPLQTDVPKGKQVELDVSQYQQRFSTLEIKKNKSSGCDSLKISQVQS